MIIPLFVWKYKLLKMNFWFVLQISKIIYITLTFFICMLRKKISVYRKTRVYSFYFIP